MLGRARRIALARFSRPKNSRTHNRSLKDSANLSRRRHRRELIANAGLLLQVDDAWLAALWDRIGIATGLAAFRKYCEKESRRLTKPWRAFPKSQVRYHICWGSWHGLHAYDLPLRDLVGIVLRVKAGAI